MIHDIVKLNIRQKHSISMPGWYSHAWNYYLSYSGSYDRCYDTVTGDVIRGWHVTAGCRRWGSINTMRQHYRKKDWRRGQYTPVAREKFRRESLAIARSIARLCRKYGIRLAHDKRGKKR